MSRVVKYVPKVWELVSEGLHPGVIQSIEFKEQVPTEQGLKDRLVIKIESDERDSETGTPLSTLSTFNRSMHENSYLRKAIRQMLGRDPGEEYDIDELIGLNISTMIEHVQVQTKRGLQTFANVSAFSKAQAGAPLLTASPIVSKENKDGMTRSANSGIPAAQIPDDLPF